MLHGLTAHCCFHLTQYRPPFRQRIRIKVRFWHQCQNLACLYFPRPTHRSVPVSQCAFFTQSPGHHNPALWPAYLRYSSCFFRSFDNLCQEKEWERSRLKLYWDSVTFFFRCLYIPVNETSCRKDIPRVSFASSLTVVFCKYCSIRSSNISTDYMLRIQIRTIIRNYWSHF